MVYRHPVLDHGLFAASHLGLLLAFFVGLPSFDEVEDDASEHETDDDAEVEADDDAEVEAADLKPDPAAHDLDPDPAGPRW